MKALSSRLQAYLFSRPTQIISPDCFTFTLNNGNQYFYTNADIPITIYDASDDDSGVLDLGILGDFTLADATGLTPRIFAANSIRIDGAKASQKIGLDVDEQDLTIYAKTPDIYLSAVSDIRSGVLGTGKLASMNLGEALAGGPSFGPSLELIEGLPFFWALREGVFDDATITRETAYLPAWGSPAIGSVQRFHGRFSSIDKVGRTEAKVKVKSDLVRLAVDMPRNIYQPSCRHTLYDAGCAINKADFAVNGTVQAGSSTTLIQWTDGNPVGYFNQGTVTFTSGVLNGEQVTVKHSSTSNILLMAPLTVAPATGDTFKAYPGCNHTASQCAARFNNLRHFLGFPRVPPPVTAV